LAFEPVLGLALAALAVPTQAQQGAPPAFTTSRGPSGGDIVGYRFIHHPVIARDGMVVGQSALASAVGVEILRQGGNAVDAAVATAFAMAVTLPRAGNLGGGGYMVVHAARTPTRPAETIAIDYYGQAPAATAPNLLTGADGKVDQGKVMSMKGVAIPGTVAGLWEAHRRYGRMSWKKLVKPAIRLAERGYYLSDDEANAHQEQRKLFSDDPAAMAIFFQSDGSVRKSGDIFVQRDLGRTLRLIARQGPAGFYRGQTAEKIIAGMRAGGGVMTAHDLAAYQPIVSQPLWSTYRGVPIALMPPTASGVTVAEALNILEKFDLGKAGWGSAEALHLTAEAVKIASTDRRLVGGGPDWRTPVTGLASKSYAAERAKLIRADKVIDGKSLQQGDPHPYESPDTTHYSVADRWGNAVSNTYTLSASYGAHVIAPGTGVLLNNSMGNLAWDARRPGPVATRPVPGKRVGSTIAPLIVFKADASGSLKPWLISGTPGGGTIVATMVQLLVNVIDYKLGLAEATERPRLNQPPGDAPLELEEGHSPDAARLLAEKGHKVSPSMTMGSVQSIMIEGERFLGAADTRRPGAGALGVR
jgi:gamma-glutamyltranspeptidase/glutathione hydrolase